MSPTDTFITANGLRLHVRDWGGPAKEPPLLLVHGLASNARIWDLTAPLLARERRVLAIDQRGHGLSDKPDDGYDYATVSADLRGAIAALGLAGPLVVGHSWGASVALRLAADAPGLLAGIALVDGGTADFAGMMSLDEALMRLAPPRLAGTPRATFLDLLRARWEAIGWSPEVEGAIMANFAVADDDTIAPHLSYENHMQVVRAMYAQRPSELYPRIQCPVLIVPAAPPVLSDEAAAWMRQKREGVRQAAVAIRHVHVIWAHDSVHDIPLHKPEFLANQLLDFARSLVR